MTDEVAKEISDIATDLMKGAHQMIDKIREAQPESTYEDAMFTAIFMSLAAIKYRMDRDDKAEMDLYNRMSKLVKP